MYYDVQQAGQLDSVFALDRAEPRQPAHRQVTAIAGDAAGRRMVAKPLTAVASIFERVG